MGIDPSTWDERPQTGTQEAVSRLQIRDPRDDEMERLKAHTTRTEAGCDIERGRGRYECRRWWPQTRGNVPLTPWRHVCINDEDHEGRCRCSCGKSRRARTEDPLPATQRTL